MWMESFCFLTGFGWYMYESCKLWCGHILFIWTHFFFTLILLSRIFRKMLTAVDNCWQLIFFMTWFSNQATVSFLNLSILYFSRKNTKTCGFLQCNSKPQNKFSTIIRNKTVVINIFPNVLFGTWMIIWFLTYLPVMNYINKILLLNCLHSLAYTFGQSVLTFQWTAILDLLLFYWGILQLWVVLVSSILEEGNVYMYACPSFVSIVNYLFLWNKSPKTWL